MKKVLLLISLVCVVFSVFGCAFASLCDPDVAPADMNISAFKEAFYWGIDYDTVLDYLSQLPGFELMKYPSAISIHTTNTGTLAPPEMYTFEFSNGKLTTISGSLYTLCMGGWMPDRLQSIADTLKLIFDLEGLDAYTENSRMNTAANEVRVSSIVADDYTIYGLFNNEQTGSWLSSVDFIFTDKHYFETGVNSADAGISKPEKKEEDGEHGSAAASGNPNETLNESAAASAPVSSREARQVGNCKYGTYLNLGDKAEIVNVGGVRMYQRPDTNPIDGVTAFQGKEFTVTDGPQCVNGVVWWEINFLGYSGWAAEMNAGGTYYMENRTPVETDVSSDEADVSSDEADLSSDEAGVSSDDPVDSSSENDEDAAPAEEYEEVCEITIASDSQSYTESCIYRNSEGEEVTDPDEGYSRRITKGELTYPGGNLLLVPTETGYFDPDGNPVTLSGGYAYYTRELSADGQTVTTTYLDADKNPVMNTSGFSRSEETFTEDKSESMRRFYDLAGQAVADSVTGAAAMRYFYDSAQRCYRIDYLDENGELKVINGQDYCTVLFEFEPSENRSYESDYLDVNGNSVQVK